jgi:hypothetical protein
MLLIKRSSGNVTAVAAGTATITATSAADSSKKDSCVVTVEAKEPAFPVLYYTGKDFNRSYDPIKDSNVVQTINADGSITITVNDEGYIDSGFVLEAGTLGGLGSITVEGTREYGLNLYFDLDNDGEFFNWNENEYNNVGDDAYALCHGTIEDGVLTVTDASKFNLMGTGGGIHTLAELKAKYGADIKIGIWVGVTSSKGDEKTATISNVTVKKLFGGGNGTEADPYLIGTFEHLKALEKLPVVSDRTYYVKLTNNIVVEENKYVNIPCYDLVMDLDNHTIFCDTNGLCIGFGSSPYTREANYTIKNGCFWQSRIRALRFRRISSLSLTISLCEHDLMSGAICN